MAVCTLQQLRPASDHTDNECEQQTNTVVQERLLLYQTLCITIATLLGVMELHLKDSCCPGCTHQLSHRLLKDVIVGVRVRVLVYMVQDSAARVQL